MNIIEAFKSGRRVRRATFRHSFDWCDTTSLSLVFNSADVLADDWEIEEEKIEITKLQLERALINMGYWNLNSQYTEDLCRRLGFKS